MENVEQNKHKMLTKLLDEAYKNVRMATFAIDCIQDKIENPQLEDLLMKQNQYYLDETTNLEEYSRSLHHTPIDINPMLKASSFANIKLKTMFNGQTSHLAQMLVEGTTMGITTLIKAINECECNDDKLVNISNNIVSRQEDFVESLKDFL